MPRTKAVSFYFLVVLISILATRPALAENNSIENKIRSDVKNGIVLIQTLTAPVEYELLFQRSGSSGFGSRVFYLKSRPGLDKSVYLARSLKPGRYRLDRLYYQKGWTLYFMKCTVEFEIRAGRVSYLGKLKNCVRKRKKKTRRHLLMALITKKGFMQSLALRDQSLMAVILSQSIAQLYIVQQ
jgi:hypothetical protein